MPLGHLGVNVGHLGRSKAFYDRLMPMLEFEPFLDREYHPGYYATFFQDPDGFTIEVVCHRRPDAVPD